MLLIDVNVLVYAFRQDSPGHASYKSWLDKAIGGDEPVGVSELVLSGFLRVVTHPRIFRPPTPTDLALEFVETFRSGQAAVKVAPGERHWDIFVRLCRTAGAKGNLIPDAYLAALALESGCEWVSTDRGYARFPGLRWRHPLEHRS